MTKHKFMKFPVTPQSDHEQQVTLQSDKEQQVTLQSDKEQQITPQSDKEQQITPQSDKEQQITPQSDKEQQITPQSDKEQQITPQSDKEQQITPQSDKEQQITLIKNKLLHNYYLLHDLSQHVLLSHVLRGGRHPLTLTVDRRRHHGLGDGASRGHDHQQDLLLDHDVTFDHDGQEYVEVVGSGHLLEQYLAKRWKNGDIYICSLWLFIIHAKKTFPKKKNSEVQSRTCNKISYYLLMFNIQLYMQNECTYPIQLWTCTS